MDGVCSWIFPHGSKLHPKIVCVIWLKELEITRKGNFIWAYLESEYGNLRLPQTSSLSTFWASGHFSSIFSLLQFCSLKKSCRVSPGLLLTPLKWLLFVCLLLVLQRGNNSLLQAETHPWEQGTKNSAEWKNRQLQVHEPFPLQEKQEFAPWLIFKTLDYCNFNCRSSLIWHTAWT